jgi:GR25 family glycosyltransferase involved in LPS biosynthesis
MVIDKIFYINLKQDTERNEYMQNQLSRFEIDFERYNAVSPTINELKHGGKYSEFFNRSVPRLRNNLNHSEHTNNIIRTMGGYLSHYFIHKLASKQNYSNYVILEDDCMLRRNWKQSLSHLVDGHDESIDIIRNFRKGCVFKFISCNYQSKHIGNLAHKIDDGSYAVMCNGTSASKIVDYFDNDYVYNVDAVYSTHKLNVYCTHFAKQKRFIKKQ